MTCAKKVFCTLFALTLAIALTLPAAASEEAAQTLGLIPPGLGGDTGSTDGDTGDTDSEIEETVLTGIDEYSTYFLKIFPVNTAPEDFGLPETVACIHSWWRIENCKVTWDFKDLDTSLPGWIEIRGEITPPPGFRLAEGLAAYYPVMLTEEGMEKEPVAEIYGSIETFLVGRGTIIDGGSALVPVSGRALPEALEYEARFGMTGTAPVTWDFSAVDTSKAGLYQVKGNISLPDCFYVPEGYEAFRVEVGVVETDRIDLSAFRSGNWLNTVHSALWLYNIEDFENISLEYALGDGDWQLASTEAGAGGRSMSVLELPCYFTGNQLTVQTRQLPVGEYYIRLLYEGRHSNVLHISIDENSLMTWDIGGDRAGADMEPQLPPFIAQPAPQPGPVSGEENPIRQEEEPEPPSEEDPASQSSDTPLDDVDIPDAPTPLADTPFSLNLQSALPAEYSGENSVSMSGIRLRELLAASGDTVLFEKHGVSVELPSDFLSSLNIADNSRLEVIIEKGNNSFELWIFIDGVSHSALPATVVYVPFDPEGGADTDDLACYDARGNEVSPAIYDAALKLVRVEIQAAGAYTIAERSEGTAFPPPQTVIIDRSGPLDALTPPAESGAGDGWLAFATAGALGLAAYVVFYLRRARVTAGARSNE